MSKPDRRGVVRPSGGTRSRRHPVAPGPHPVRAVAAMWTVLAMCAAVLVAVGSAPASATQASGVDVPVWSNGWSWTYDTTFNYDGDAATANVKETVTYTNTGRTTFHGQDAYELDISGSIYGGSGHANAAGGVDLSDFSGSVSGTRYVRASDLALLQEHQKQHLNATAKKFGLPVDVTANINLTLTPSPGWRTHDFPLNSGDSWHNNESVAYTGGFDYDAGSIASGSSPFDGSFPFNATSHVTNSGSNKVIKASASTSDGTVTDNITYSPSVKNDSYEHMVLPLSGATLAIDRDLTSSHTPAPSTVMTTTITPSLTCAGGPVTVHGKVGNASGRSISVVLDQSQLSPGREITAHTTTTANGNYSATLTAPGQSDGLSKSGSRANWGVLVSGGGATGAATLVVSHVDCTTLSYIGATSAARGTDATVSARLTDLGGGSAAHRTVTFRIDGGGSTTATTDASGVATASLPVGDTVRDTTVHASFAGTSTLQSASDSAPFSVVKVGTSTTVRPSLPSVDAGDPVSFTAEVTPGLAGAGTPGGTVQFKVDGANFGGPVTLDGGSATSAEITTLAEGTHTVQAVYLGGDGFAGSSSAEVSFTVTPPHIASQTSLSTSPSTAVHGQTVRLSATVTGGGATPTGSVTFTSGTDTLGTIALDGSGTAELTTTLPVGTANVVATYSGDATYKASHSTARTVTVAKADAEVDLSASDASTVAGEAVDYTVAVQPVAPGAGTPTGTVQLLVDGTPAGDPMQLVGGSAAFPTLTSLTAGSHTIEATYAGDAGFNGDSDQLTQTVTQAETTTTLVVAPSPSNQGQLVELTASVAAVAPGSGDPTGTVTFSSDGDELGTAPVIAGADGDQASLGVDSLAPGDHTITAVYAGDGNYASSTSEPQQTTIVAAAALVATTTQLASVLNPATYGQLISFTATVGAEDGSTPVGAVQFSVDGTDLGGPVPVDASGVATSVTLPAPDPGDHTVLAKFVPGTGYTGSGATLTQTVNDADVSVSLTSSEATSRPGQSVRFTADVGSMQLGTGTPTGFVQFRVDGQPLGDAVALADGEAVSPAVADLAPGDHAVSATYSGDIHFVSKSNSITQTVAKIATTTKLTLSDTSTTYGDSVTLKATITPESGELGAPDGTVTFSDGDTVLGTVPATPGSGASTASIAVDDLPAGDHSLRATYSGSADFAGSSSEAGVVVVKQLTSMHADPALVHVSLFGPLPLLNLDVDLTIGEMRATLTTPDGPLAGAPVEFTIGQKTVCTATTDAAGVASCGALAQVLGLVLNNGYTASYAGDAHHQGSSAHGGIIG